MNGLALGSMITGIIGAILALFIYAFGGLILGIVAIVLGILGQRRANEMGGTGKAMAVAGIALGALSIVLFIYVVVALSSSGVI